MKWFCWGFISKFLQKNGYKKLRHADTPTITSTNRSSHLPRVAGSDHFWGDQERDGPFRGWGHQGDAEIPQALLFPTLEKTCFWKNNKTSKVELAETKLSFFRGYRINQWNKLGFKLWKGSGSRLARSQTIVGCLRSWSWLKKIHGMFKAHFLL